MEIKKSAGIKGKIRQETLSDEAITDDFVLNYPLKDRHKKIIELIYFMRMMNTSDIIKASGYSKNYARDTLRELYQNRFIFRQIRPYEDRMNMDRELYYMLDKAGAMFIRDYHGLSSLDDVKWSVRDQKIKYDMAKHGLKIGTIYAQIEGSASKEKDTKIIEAYADRHLYTKYKYNNKNYSIVPDMYFRIKKSNIIYSYFMEVDMGTMAMSGLQNTTSFDKKVLYYETFKRSPEASLKFNVFPRVLVITTTLERAEKLAKVVKAAQTELDMKEVDFVFSFFDIFKENPFGKVFIDSNGMTKTIFDK